VVKGVRLTVELNDKALFTECAEILRQQKHFLEAAQLYLKAENYDKAGEIYANNIIINDRSRIGEAALVMEKVQNDSVNTTFAEFCKKSGKYEEAAKAYTRAKDLDKVSAFPGIKGEGDTQCGACVVTCVFSTSFFHSR